MKSYNSYLISCQKASFLIEKKLGHALNSKETVQLFIHKLICNVCRKYEKQSRALDLILRKKIAEDVSEPGNFSLDAESLDKFKYLIKSKLQ